MRNNFEGIEEYLEERKELETNLALLTKKYGIMIVQNPEYNEECYFPFEETAYIQLYSASYDKNNNAFYIGYSEDETKYLFAAHWSRFPRGFGRTYLLYIDKIDSNISRQRDRRAQGTCELRYLSKDKLILKHRQKYDNKQFEEYYRIVSLVEPYHLPFINSETFVKTEYIKSPEEALRIWESGFETLEELEKALKRTLGK